MNVDYQTFLAGKRPRALAVGIDPPALNPGLFDFQAACVDFALRQGRCGLYLDTGLGKTFCQLEWADKKFRRRAMAGQRAAKLAKHEARP